MPGRVLGGIEPAMEHFKKSSLSGIAGKRHSSKDRSTKDAAHNHHTLGKSHLAQPAATQSTAAKSMNTMSMKIESPPNVFYGTPQQSTGALFSGQLIVDVVEPEITLATFSVQLLAVITACKPVAKDCLDCMTKTTKLFTWTFITEPKRLRHGKHGFPFSYLLPGHLPATTHGSLGNLEYLLDAKATTLPTPKKPQSEQIVYRKPISLSRALMPSPEKNSLRIFPPTNLTAHVTMSPTIYPIGDFNILMKLQGVTEKHPDHQQRWRLRKVTWRLEEVERMISPACDAHASKVGGQGKGIQHEETRLLGQAELKDGWKNDWDEGNIELDFSARPNGTTRPICDVESPTGLTVSHSLVIELVVAEEWAWNKRPASATPSGAARVLRAQFNVTVTERAGMGISWDEEQPPMYEDVPASPPLYGGAIGPQDHGLLDDYTGPPLEPEEDGDVDGLMLNVQRPSPPASRHGGPS